MSDAAGGGGTAPQQHAPRRAEPPKRRRIVSVEVRAVGEQHAWNFYGPGMLWRPRQGESHVDYHHRPTQPTEALRSTLTVCRIRTACGLEGVGGVTQYSVCEFDATTATHLTRHLAPRLLGRDPFLIEEIMARCCGWIHFAITPHHRPSSSFSLSLHTTTHPSLRQLDFRRLPRRSSRQRRSGHRPVGPSRPRLRPATLLSPVSIPRPLHVT